jgi:hypothetical protein
MHRKIDQAMDRLKDGIMSGQVAQTETRAQELEAQLTRYGLGPADLPMIEPRLRELRDLADAAARGALQALEDTRTILLAGRFVQTYDRLGQRRDDLAQEAPARRF